MSPVDQIWSMGHRFATRCLLCCLGQFPNNGHGQTSEDLAIQEISITVLGVSPRGALRLTGIDEGSEQGHNSSFWACKARPHWGGSF